MSEEVEKIVRRVVQSEYIALFYSDSSRDTLERLALAKDRASARLSMPRHRVSSIIDNSTLKEFSLGRPQALQP